MKFKNLAAINLLSVNPEIRRIYLYYKLLIQIIKTSKESIKHQNIGTALLVKTPGQNVEQVKCLAL